MAPGETRTITATFAVPEGYAAPNPIVNRAQVSSTTTDPDPTNNAADGGDAGQPLGRRRAAQAGVAGDGAGRRHGHLHRRSGQQRPERRHQRDRHRPAAGRPAAHGASASQGIYLASPAGEWSVGRLGVGESAQLTLTAIVTQSGAITNIATKTGANEPDPDTSNDTAAATVNGGPAADVGVAKSVDDPFPGTGEMVTFTVRATNHGPSDATGIVVRGRSARGPRLPERHPVAGHLRPGDRVVGGGRPGPGGSATLTLQATRPVERRCRQHGAEDRAERARPESRQRPVERDAERRGNRGRRGGEGRQQPRRRAGRARHASRSRPPTSGPDVATNVVAHRPSAPGASARVGGAERRLRSGDRPVDGRHARRCRSRRFWCSPWSRPWPGTSPTRRPGRRWTSATRIRRTTAARPA